MSYPLQLEKIFPPSFFDIMVHLTIHLAYEAQLGGPVQYRWMYPIERYLSTLKSYVRNRSRPEGSIAEGYLMEECLNFCSRYLEDVDPKFNKVHRNDAVNGENTGEFPIYSYLGRHIGKVNCIVLDKKIRTRAHQYILFNCAEIASFIEEHKVIVKDAHPRLNKKDIERTNSETFADWLYNHVSYRVIQIFTLVNFSRARQNSEPFILASQAQQVFYVEDPNEKGWRVAVKTNARDSFDMDPVLSSDLDALHTNSGIDAQQIDENEVVWIREDVDGIMI